MQLTTIDVSTSYEGDLMAHYAAVRMRLMGKPKRVVRVIEPPKEEPEIELTQKELDIIELEKVAAREFKKHKLSYSPLDSFPFSWAHYIAKIDAAKAINRFIHTRATSVTRIDGANVLGVSHKEFDRMLIISPHVCRHIDAGWREIIEETARKHKSSIAGIMTRRKRKESRLDRFEMWHLIRENVTWKGGRISYPIIARIFDVHHTTIISGVQTYRSIQDATSHHINSGEK